MQRNIKDYGVHGKILETRHIHIGRSSKESCVAYMNGKNFSTAQRQSVEFAACQTGKPQSRYFHASVAIELSPKGNVVRRKTKNVILVHGGSDGFIRNDSWVFVNGLIDSSKVPYTANVSRDTYNPIDGTSCNDCPMPIDGSGQKPCNQQQQTLHCLTVTGGIK